MKKLASDIYKLAWEVENKTASRWSRFRDKQDNTFFIPYDQTEKALRMFSPFTRRLSPRDGLFNIVTPPKLEQAFVVTSAEPKTSSTKTAEKLIIFECADGRTFALPYGAIGNKQFAWSPWDASYAKRTRIVKVPLNQKVEEAFVMEASSKKVYYVEWAQIKGMSSTKERKGPFTSDEASGFIKRLKKTEKGMADRIKMVKATPQVDVKAIEYAVRRTLARPNITRDVARAKIQRSFGHSDEVLSVFEDAYEKYARTASTKTATVHGTILRQMSGQRRLSAMVGAKNFISYPAEADSKHGEGLGGVAFRFSNPSRGAPNHLKIILDISDTYILEFGRIRGQAFKVTKRYEGIYYSQLKSLFEKETGLYLSL